MSAPTVVAGRSTLMHRRAGEAERAAAPSSSLRNALFALTLFISASLVFVIEPMFGKMVLPRLGGTPAVWNTCMVFYQTVLLAGYGYAHVLSRRCPLPAQIAIHSALLLAAAFLPVSLAADWAPPVDRSPIPALVAQLARGVGAPLLMLCATAPLLQNWFSKASDGDARDPYFLYAVSNVGSILALVAYPVLIEPATTVTVQRTFWSYLYLLLVGLILGCGAIAWRTSAADRPSLSKVPAPGAAAAQGEAGILPIAWPRRARWIALSFVPSSLMLGATTYISTDVASAPLLWTIPLALYLLSFVIGFSRRRPLSDTLAWRCAATALLVLTVILSANIRLPTVALVALHLSALLSVAVSLHSSLADDRPHSEHLTEFYLWISVGGVAGGLFNSLAAPLIFSSVAEYPLALAAAAWLLRTPTPAPWRWYVPMAAAITGAAVAGIVFLLQRQAATPLVLTVPIMALVTASLVAGRRRAGMGLAVSCVLVGGLVAGSNDGHLLYIRRTFFGVLRVWDIEREHQHRFMHGTTLHGVQSTAAGQTGEPLSYYHRAGPVGQIFTGAAARLTHARIGVVGLGAGELLAYRQPEQDWTFYEIDPEVERIARNPALFTYLRDCGSWCHVELGDARLSLARSRAGQFDMLILDAFSSDAIPVHLMTREALALYLEQLRPGGLLVFHISNRHLQLRPLVAALAGERQLAARVQFFHTSSPDVARLPSEWVVIGRRPDDLGSLASDSRWKPLTAQPGRRVWTDDFSDILSVLKL